MTKSNTVRFASVPCKNFREQERARPLAWCFGSGLSNLGNNFTASVTSDTLASGKKTYAMIDMICVAWRSSLEFE